MRCLLFSSDNGTAELIFQVLGSLGVEAESCSEAVAAVERVSNQPFQIVIIDWDKQPEAGFLLTTARERKASERPLTLAIVSDDASVPKALQAGANSILRKPFLISQVTDTLTTARDLLRAKQESAIPAAQAAAAGHSAGSPPGSSSASTGTPASMDRSQKTLRAGEFLQSANTAPGTQFVVDSDAQRALEHPAGPATDQLKELEPMAASVAAEETAPAPPPPPSEPRGLQWYLNARAGTLPPVPAQTEAPPPAAKPELLGYDQTPAHSEASVTDVAERAAPEEIPHPPSAREQRSEAVLFSYIAGETEPSEEKTRSSSGLGKKAILWALALAACAIAVAPQAPWHPTIRSVWARGQKATHAWLNPQPVTPVQAPAAHEDFGRPGDEYKLPVAENIPDATTDPSQIRVVPVVDPTAKKPGDGSNPDQTPGQADGSGTAPVDPTQPSGVQVQENQPQTVPPTTTPANGSDGTGAASPPGASPSSAPASTAPASANPSSANPSSAAPSSTTPGPAVTVSAAVEQPHSDTPAVVFPSASPVSPQPAPPQNPPTHYVSSPANTIPSSLKSHMASTTPDSSGSKSPETALPSIEPVVIPEATERSLLTEQPPIDYPANAKSQQGTVVLQVLIGRDGTVQDAKFLQGSLAFARTAIDGVRLWKFKPYSMNGRAVSVQTLITMSFKPTS